MSSQVAQERLSYISTLYKQEDAERQAMAEKLSDLGIIIPDRTQLPFERVYFNGDMLAKYEPCMDAFQRVVEADGEDDDAWKSFEQLFGKFMDFTWCSQVPKLPPKERPYDLIIYGCSGYTGYLSMQYLLRVAFKKTPEKLKVGFAGRTASKVTEMRDRNFDPKLPQWQDTSEHPNLAVFQASYDDPVSMIDMAFRTRAIYNVAGPYLLTPGEIMIDACCFGGTHYVDINGEIPWMARVNDLHERAKDCNAIIAPASAAAGGFPDVLLYMAAKMMREDHGEALASGCCYWLGGGSGAGTGGGTLATRDAMSNAGDAVRKLMADPFALGGFIPDRDRNGLKEVSIQKGTGEAKLKVRKDDNDAILAKMSEDTINDCWRVAHVYAYFDTRIVRRTNALMADYLGTPYGRSFNFTEYGFVPSSIMKEMGNQAVKQAVTSSGTSAAAEKEQLEKSGKYYKQGEGPALEDLSDVWLCWLMFVITEGGHHGRNCAMGKDGYFETARVAVETALTLVHDYEKLPLKGGCVTCAAACGEHVFKRLVNSGLKFKAGEWFKPEECGPPDA
jgi:short subunit dehydrogenase-like uncharacterized protein